MERTVPFVEVEPSLFQATHVEPLADGLAIMVIARTFFPKHNVLFPKESVVEAGYARIELNLSVSHFGKEVTRRSGNIYFSPKNTQKIYAERYALYVGDRKFETGFAGKLKSRGKFGWLPKFLHVKLTPVIE